MVGLNNKTTPVHYSEFNEFCNHQVYIYFTYVFLKSVNECKYDLHSVTDLRKTHMKYM